MPSKPTTFESLLEAVSDAVVGLDQAGVIRFVNHQTELLFGYDRDHLVGMHIETVVPESPWPLDTDRREANFADDETRGTGLGLQLIGRRQDGTRLRLSVSLSHLGAGDVLLTIRATPDVSEPGLTYADPHLMMAIVQDSNDAIYGGTLDGVITFWNPAAERMYGYSPQEAIGRRIHLVSPEDRTREIDTTLAKIKSGHKVEHLETVRVRKDGTVLAVSLTISPIRDPNGAVVGAFSIARDVTEQRHAHEAAQRLAAIVENSDDAIVGTTLRGVITNWNPAAERMFGYRAAEMIGRDGRILVIPDRHHEVDDTLAKIAAGQHVNHAERTRLRKDGTPLTVTLTASPIRGQNGTIIGTSAIYRDVTRQRQTEQAARSMIESSLDSLVSISPEGKITDVNEATVKLTGVPREKLIGTDFSQYFTDPEKANEIYQLVFTDGMALDYPLTLRPQDGPQSLTEVLYNASLYRDSNGVVLGVFAAARNVTAQNQAQRAMDDQQAKEQERLADLERFQRLTVGRELKMIELKKEIEYLRKLDLKEDGESDRSRSDP